VVLITITAMVISVIFHTLLHRAIPEKEYIPDTPESLVLLLPCYNENKDTRWIPLSDKSKSTNIAKP
jgi:chitin synthase